MPRTIFYSKEFLYPKEYELALKEFETKIRMGEDLTPFMSDKIRNSAYDDLLLNDWGIYHFHLSRRFRDDGFVGRSQYQIFAFVTDAAFYMIQTYDHSDENLYCKQEMVRILRDNWPEITEKTHLQGVTELTEKITDSDYKVLRHEHISTLVELGENEVYWGMGGGYASNGYSISALRQADYTVRSLDAFQALIIDNVEAIGMAINKEAGEDLHYRRMGLRFLWLDSFDMITVCDCVSGMVIQIDGKKGRIRVCKGNEVFDKI
ncbi:hypothetical protein [Butyrivibrio sp. INlla16]|uniref:hypothetical protein n=1 Tax=Butyrivibrio sp. INlla16 TaxID=1520807 RepID=UPI0011135909|nr:hypothetical protein [Butyrivibrio sp. INlla16]